MITDFDFILNTKKINEKIQKMDLRKYFDDFFTFNNLDAINIYNFLFLKEIDEKEDDENKVNIRVSDINCILIKSWHDFEFSNEMLISLEGNIDIDYFITSFCNTKDKLVFFRTLLKYVLYSSLKLDLNFCYKQVAKDEIDYTEGMIQIQKENTCMFRGESNYAWNIIPSLVRNITLKNGLYIDYQSLFKLYEERNYPLSLIEKYKSYFGKICYIDYKFLSWMQHSISYSPLVDFTTDYRVALSFAVKANNPNNFMFDDSAIYIIDFSHNDNFITDENQVNNIISSMHIAVLNSKIKPGSVLNIKDLNGNIHLLNFKSYKNIINQLIPKYLIIDIPTNDRMIVQKGKFLLFYNYVVVNGKMFSTINNNIHIFKHKILANDKPALLKWLHDNSKEIIYSYLMDPYKFFND